MDKTKKYTILFVIACFIGIGFIGLKNNKPTKPIQENISDQNKICHVHIVIKGIDKILDEDDIEIEEGKSVYDVLEKLCDQRHQDIKTTGFGKIIYVSEMYGLKEFDYGSQSGWKYRVNGTYPGSGAGAYQIKDGDRIEWEYQKVK